MARSRASAASCITSTARSAWRRSTSLIQSTNPSSRRSSCVPVRPTATRPSTSSQSSPEPGMTLQELGRHTAQEFAKTYGRPPRWIAAAPGRGNLLGEHPDYNDGFVLPMAIDRYTVIAAAPGNNGAAKIHLRPTVGGGESILDLTQPLRPAPKGVWSNYPVGVIAGFLARGATPYGFDALIHSTVPLGGGLSSSAALEVSTATLLEAITGCKLDPVEKALLCQKAEHDYAGVDRKSVV